MLLLGVSDTFWFPISLPLDLSPGGLPGCTLYVSGEIIFQLQADPMGFLSWPPPAVSIPNDNALLGASFFNQALIRDPGVNPTGFTVTNAGRGIIGP